MDSFDSLNLAESLARERRGGRLEALSNTSIVVVIVPAVDDVDVGGSRVEPPIAAVLPASNASYQIEMLPAFVASKL